MTGNIYYRPIIPLLLSLITGISCGLLLPGYSLWAYFFTASCFVFLLIKIIRKKSAVFLPIILFIFLGYLSIQPWLCDKISPSNISYYADSAPINISGRVIENPEIKNNRLSFVLLAKQIEDKGNNFPVSGKINVKVFKSLPDISAGDSVWFKSRIRSIRNFNNPGGFDYKRYMSFKGISGIAYVSGDKIRIEKEEKNITGTQLIENARKKFSVLIDNTVPAAEAGVLKALIIGDKSFISKKIREDFNRTGTSHVLAISGLHVGIVAAVCFLLFKTILSYSNLFLWNAWTKKGAAILSLFPVILYGLIAGMSPSTQRAVIMVSVFLISFFIEKDQDAINTLAVAALLILAFYPPSLFMISFQLSFISVFFIILGMNYTIYRKNKKSEYDKGWLSGIKRKTAAFFLVSFFAIIGTLPLVMYYFNQISLVGLVTNCIAVPLIGFVAVPAGLLSFFIYPISSIFSMWLLKAASAVLEIALGLIKYFADLPFAALKTITPSIFEIVWYYLLLFTLFVILKRIVIRKETIKSSTILESIRLRAPLIALIFLIIAGYANSWYWLDKRFLHKDLKVTVIDVGQGTSSLLELPGGYNVLVDGGGFSDNSVFDVGRYILAPFLWKKKINTVDTLVLSHIDSDHLNGLLYIAKNFHVKEVWSNGEAKDSLGYKNFLEIIRKKNIKMQDYSDINKGKTINGVMFKILYPEAGFMEKKDTWRKGDNSSLVLKTVFGTKSFLFTGDIKAKGEADLIRAADELLKSTVVIVPHHGSKSSSSQKFIDKVNPEIAIISAGWKNRYKLPSPVILDRYEKRMCNIYRTDENGAIEMSTDGKELMITPSIGKVES
ncbi:MAG: DNA internalization-related competence protein ComEC/Rec2 [Pseudomonadota bacterium]